MVPCDHLVTIVNRIAGYGTWDDLSRSRSTRTVEGAMSHMLRLMAALLIVQGAWANSALLKTSVKISNGLTRIDFTGDGREDLVLLSNQSNFNAHGVQIVTFYTYDQDVLLAIPVELAAVGNRTREILVSGGADCILHDFRLFAGQEPNTATLILADRA